MVSMRLLAVAMAVLAVSTVTAGPDCKAIFGGSSVTVLMVADPGSFSGNAEGKHFLGSLQGKRNISSFTGSSCAPASNYSGAYVGKIAGQSVLIVTSGIGPTTAALCTAKLLTCASVIKEFIYQGTSGWSAAVGGILNPPNCNTSNPNTAKGLVTRVGDVCVSPFSLNWACMLASWDQQCSGSPNECSAPGAYFDPTADFLYGKCVFAKANKADLALTHELLDATKTPTWRAAVPARNQGVHDAHDVMYWNTTNMGTNRSYHMYDIADPPTIYNYTVCSEVDAQFFWSGAPWDYTGRQYTAVLLNQALNTTTYNASNVIAVSAMEAIGFTQALNEYHDAGNKHIPYTYVRGNSDYTHTPVSYSGKGVWATAPFPYQDYTPGYTYAIATYSSVTLTMLKLRCLKQAGMNKAKAAACTVTIDYA